MLLQFNPMDQNGATQPGRAVCDPEKQTLKLHTTCITQQNDKQGLDN